MVLVTTMLLDVESESKILLVGKHPYCRAHTFVTGGGRLFFLAVSRL